MDNIKFDIVVIDLRRYSSEEDLSKIIENHSLKIDPKKVLPLGEKYSKIFIDKVSSELFAVIYRGKNEVTISQHKEDTLLKLESLKIKENKIELSVDYLLDKINQSGIESLTAYEKLFLKKNS